MNRLLLVLLAVGAGAIGFNVSHRAAEATRTTTVLSQQEWEASTKLLLQTQEMAAALHSEVREKKNRLLQVVRHPELSPELLSWLEGDAFKGHTIAWAELRQQLGIGWDNSPDYVLVSKRVLKELDYPRLVSLARIDDTAGDLLALSPDEQSALKVVLRCTRESWQGSGGIMRIEPRGDIVAQYTVPPTDLVFEQGLSNNFATGITGVVGPERADLLLPKAWREFRSELGPVEAETMTIRNSVVEGEPDLLCEMKQGDNVRAEPVRYGHYPSSWFLTVFPGGWKTLAEREGFELPQKYQK